MELLELAPGLWRWTAPHPEWKPGATPGSPADWDRVVGCVAYQAPAALVLIDPLVPDEGWKELDVLVGGGPVAVLRTIRWHKRSISEVVERFGASTEMPAGVEPFRVRRGGETIFWLPEHAALVPGDRILGGEGGGLRLCPQSWLRYLRSGLTTAELRETLRPLLDLPVERVLVSHGEPVLENGHAELARLLAA